MIVYLANPTFPLSVALVFCYFGVRYGNGLPYAMALCGIFWANGAIDVKRSGHNPKCTNTHHQNHFL